MHAEKRAAATGFCNMLNWLIDRMIGSAPSVSCLPTNDKAAQKPVDMTSAADLPSYLHLILH